MEYVTLGLALLKIVQELTANGANLTPEQEQVIHDATVRLNAAAHAEDKIKDETPPLFPETT